MAERLELYTGGSDDLPATMWSLDGFEAIEWLLVESGFDPDAASIDQAIANIHPNKLPPAVVETLSETERQQYHYEQWVVEHGRVPTNEELNLILEASN